MGSFCSVVNKKDAEITDNKREKKLYDTICNCIQNKKGADRLIQLRKDQYPYEPLEWIYQKVLDDLATPIIISQ